MLLAWTTTPWTLPSNLGLCVHPDFDYVKITDEMEQALSTQRHLDRLHTPLILTHGTLETPEFQRQSRDFHAAVKAAGKPIELRVGQGYNHFETQETLANPYGFMGRAAFEQMKLSAT